MRRVLFSVFRENGWRPALLSLDTKEWQLVGSGRAIGGGAQYFPTGHLVHAQSEGLVAQPFDLERATLGGSPIPLLERLAASRFRTAPLAVAADAGALVYLPAARDPPERTLVRRP